MADTKTTGLTANTAPVLTDLICMIDDPGGSAASQKITYQNARRQLFPYGVCGGRLTLTTATPVTTADVSAAGTLYFTPYSAAFGCGQVGLYDGSTGWDVLNFTELSLNISAYTASKPYDIWIYNNSGTAALDSTVWTNSTTRATALAVQDGVYVKTGATTRRYLGTIYINSSGGQTDDSVAKRNVWNYYNRVVRNLYAYEATSHAYGTGAWRLWNNSTTNNNREITIGVAENAVTIGLYVSGTAGNVFNQWFVGVSYDVTNATLDAAARVASTNTSGEELGAMINHVPAAGNHYYAVVEYVSAGVNATLQFMGLRVNLLG